MARGIERNKIFKDDSDREDFVQRISQLAESENFIAYAWSLMPNHFHLLVRTGNQSLSRNMRSLMTGYAGYYNRLHKRRGHLFQNRFKSVICDEDTYLLELVRYLHLNPLRAGIVKDIRMLDRYPYSGHSCLMGKVDRPWQQTKEVLKLFGRAFKPAREKYRQFVRDGIANGKRQDLMGGGLVRSAGGWENVAVLRQGRESYRSDERILGSTDFVETILKAADDSESKNSKIKRISLNVLKRRICAEFEIKPRVLESGSRVPAVSHVRAVLCYVWVRYLGRSGRKLAQELGVSPQAVYSGSARIEQEKSIRDDELESWCR